MPPKAKRKEVGPARDALGRFVSSARARAQADARAGRLTVEKKGGREYIRDEGGRFVSKSVARLQHGGPHRVIRKKGKRVRVGKPRVSPSKAPRGTNTVAEMQLFGGSAPRLVEDNALRGRQTFIRWNRKVYRVDSETAGRMADQLRAMMSDYVNEFLDIVDSPQLKVDLIETNEGDVLDIDRLHYLSEELSDELMGEAELERRAQRFSRSVERQMNKITHEGESNSKVKRRPSLGPRARKPDSRKGKKRRSR